MRFAQLFKASLRAISNDSTSRLNNKLLLTLVSPTQTFYCRQPILSITIPGIKGAFTLTNHHSQIISQLKPGLVTVRDNENAVRHFFITNGFASLTAPTDDSMCSTAYVSAVDMEKLTDISQNSAVEILEKLKEKSCSTNKERVLNDLAFMTCWKPIEANPEILKQYTQRLGGPEKCEFYDVFSTEDWAVDMLPLDIDGLLLVYSITNLSSMKDEQRNSEYNEKIKNNVELFTIHETIWFMNQTVENACGTVALFHLFANGNRSLLQSNGVLSDFLVQTKNMNSLERAEAFKHAPSISAAHHAIENDGQSLLRSTDIELADSCHVNEHFIAYKDYGDYIAELDGRKSQPILHEKISFINETTAQKSNLFLRNALLLIQQNYMILNPSDIRFTIIAVRSSP